MAHGRGKKREGSPTRLYISWGVLERSVVWVPRAYLHTRTQGGTLIQCEKAGKDGLETET